MLCFGNYGGLRGRSTVKINREPPCSDGGITVQAETDMELPARAMSSSHQWFTELIHVHIFSPPWAGRQLRPLCAANTAVPLFPSSSDQL
jgi:hypothetical protein